MSWHPITSQPETNKSSDLDLSLDFAWVKVIFVSVWLFCVHLVSYVVIFIYKFFCLQFFPNIWSLLVSPVCIHYPTKLFWLQPCWILWLFKNKGKGEICHDTITIDSVKVNVGLNVDKEVNWKALQTALTFCTFQIIKCIDGDDLIFTEGADIFNVYGFHDLVLPNVLLESTWKIPAFSRHSKRQSLKARYSSFSQMCVKLFPWRICIPQYFLLFQLRPPPPPPILTHTHTHAHTHWLYENWTDPLWPGLY